MNFLCDFLFFAIIIISLYFGYKKGFIKTFFSFFESLISLIITIILVKPVSSFINGKMVLPAVTKYVDSSISQIDSMDGLSSVADNSKIIGFISKFGSVTDKLKSLFADTLLGGNFDIENLRHGVSEIIASPIAKIISTIIALVLLFIVINIALKIAEVVLDIVAKLPIIKSSNKFLGIIFGLLRGVLLALIFARVIVIAEPVLQNSNKPFFSEIDLEDTIMIKASDKINPLNQFISIDEGENETE